MRTYQVFGACIYTGEQIELWVNARDTEECSAIAQDIGDMEVALDITEIPFTPDPDFNPEADIPF